MERKRAYAKASQQAARDSLEMQRVANSEVGVVPKQAPGHEVYTREGGEGDLIAVIPLYLLILSASASFARRCSVVLVLS